MYNNRFCYRISKEVKIGWDEELNDYCEAYVQTAIKTVKQIPVNLKNSMIGNLKDGLANQLEINPKYLKYIEPDEYDQYVD